MNICQMDSIKHLCSTNRSIAIIVGSTTGIIIQANAPLSALILSLCVEQY